MACDVRILCNCPLIAGFVRAVVHTVTLVYSLISLNIAVNAFDNSLLTLLLSNQFVEIKGSVFKKFEKDNLFQITCAGAVLLFPSEHASYFWLRASLLFLSSPGAWRFCERT